MTGGYQRYIRTAKRRGISKPRFILRDIRGMAERLDRVSRSSRALKGLPKCLCALKFVLASALIALLLLVLSWLVAELNSRA